LPVGHLKQPVRQQIVGWVEPFAKPIAVVRNMMGIASLHPSYALVWDNGDSIVARMSGAKSGNE
jgi:hypothetical protein